MFVRTKVALAATAFLLADAALAAPPAPVFVMKAGASDLYEKTASQLVLASSHNPDVRRFATMMVTDHSKSTMMVKSAAMKSGLHPKQPMLDAIKTRMVADLRHSNGKARDALYLDQQKQVHAEALGLMQDYAATGTAPALRHAAGEIVPVVQHHIEMLDGMAM